MMYLFQGESLKEYKGSLRSFSLLNDCIDLYFIALLGTQKTKMEVLGSTTFLCF